MRLPREPVSVLKPLCGAEPRLYENLSTFCEQTHPCYELLFGVSSSADPAIAVVRRTPTAIFGSWKAAVRTVDYTKNPATVTITPDARAGSRTATETASRSSR